MKAPCTNKIKCRNVIINNLKDVDNVNPIYVKNIKVNYEVVSYFNKMFGENMFELLFKNAENIEII